MNERNVYHATFAIERRYRASVARVFSTWSQPEWKAQWFACHDGWQPRRYALDFRVGGREHLETGPAGEACTRSTRAIATSSPTSASCTATTCASTPR